MVDAVRHMLSEIEPTGTDGENDYLELLATLERLLGKAESSPETSQEKEGSIAVVPR